MPNLLDETLNRLPKYDETRWKWRENIQAIYVGLGVWLISVFLYAPALWTILEPGRVEASRAGDFLKLCANPLARDLREPILAYRPVTPLLCWLLQLRGWGALLLPYLGTIGALACIHRALARRVGNMRAVWLCLAVSTSWTVVWPNTKLGMPDGVTHLAIAVCLLSPAPGLCAVMTFLGTLNDERFLLAAPFVFLWHASRSTSLSEFWLKSWRLLAGFFVGLVGMLLVRHALAVGWIGPGIAVAKSYTNSKRILSDLPGWLREEGGIYIVNVFVAWRWLWLVWLAALVVLWRHGGRWWMWLIGAGIAGVVLASSLVADVSRSIGFAFPAFLALWVAAEKLEPIRLQRWLVWAVALCIFTPNIYLTDNVQWVRPFPLSVLRWLTGWDALNLLR
jgi:hypothetical protein